MAGRSGGQVLERRWKSGKGFALRFHAYGERRYLTLGLAGEGWTRKRAEEELQNILADVRRQIWVPPERSSPAEPEREESQEHPETPLFGPFAKGLVDARRGQISDAHLRYLNWCLSHLMPYFADWVVNEIDTRAVDDYRAHKVAEADPLRAAIERRRPLRDHRGNPRRPLGASSINKTIEALQWVLSFAVEYGHLAKNPAEGKRRRLLLPQRRPIHLDNAEQIEVLLEASSALDRETRRPSKDRLAVNATLTLAGLRAHELCNLTWQDTDLVNGRIQVASSKTQAGIREVSIGPLLRDILSAYKDRSTSAGPDDLVFPTRLGGKRDKNNLRSRMLLPALERADELLGGRGKDPLPEGVSPHKLRHTFASTLVASGEDPASVMGQLGHTDPKFTLKVYTHMMRRSPGERERLTALVRGDYRQGPSAQALIRLLP
jgi:integrase